MAGPVKARISSTMVDALEGAAWRAYPHEACALLLGRRIEGTVIVDQIAVTENVTAEDPKTTFEIDPSMHILLQKAARAGGPTIVGVWHTHPDGAANPSETDKARSVEPGWLWLISAGQGGAFDHAAFWAPEDIPQKLEPASLEIVSS